MKLNLECEKLELTEYQELILEELKQVFILKNIEKNSKEFEDKITKILDEYID